MQRKFHSAGNTPTINVCVHNIRHVVCKAESVGWNESNCMNGAEPTNTTSRFEQQQFSFETDISGSI